MSVAFQLPNIGEGVDSADIAEILVAEGDEITADQIVMELETDKAVVELPCPHAGTVGKLLVSEGDTITVGQTLFEVEASEAGKKQSSDGDAEEESSDDAATAENAATIEDSEPANDTSSSETEDVEAEDAEAEDAPSEAAEGSTQTLDFQLPNIGEGVESADIAEIHVSEGDALDADQVVMDLETEKAVVELPCPHAGVVAKLHVAPGETVTVGQTLLTLERVAAGAGKTASAKQQPARSKSAAAMKEQPSQRTAQKPTEREPAVSTRSSRSDSNGESARDHARARTPEIVSGDENGHPPVPAAPSTRRLARQLGVDLRHVGGSGPGGRITQEDVQDYVKRRLSGGLAAASAGGLSVSAAGSLAPPPLPDFSKYGPVERERLSKLGRTAAENLTVSWNVIPHVTQHDRADVTELEAARKRFSKGAGANGPKVTMTAIVIKALATALSQNPKFNSSLDPETQEIVYKRYYHIGCAVDTPNGLLVPVVKHVDQKSIRQVAGEIGELAALARDRKLPMEAMQGATCTVTNLGGIGGVAFTPIINYPEVCILGLARGQQELRLQDGELVERLMLPLSLSYDHRVINGADAARFLVTLCEMLSDPFQLLSAI